MTDLSNDSKEHLENFAIFELEKNVVHSVTSMLLLKEENLKQHGAEAVNVLRENQKICKELLAMELQDKKGIGSEVEKETRRLVKAITSSEQYRENIDLPQGNFAAYLLIYFINKTLAKYKSEIKDVNLRFPEKWQRKHIDIEFLAVDGVMTIGLLADKFKPNKNGFFNLAYMCIDRTIKSRINQSQLEDKSYDPFADARDACK